MIRLIAFLILLFALPAQAADFDYKGFSALPIQHEGRIKPIDSFARGTLEQLAGKDSINGMRADAWLAQTLFDPAQALEVPVFRLLPENHGFTAMLRLPRPFWAKTTSCKNFRPSNRKTGAMTSANWRAFRILRFSTGSCCAVSLSC